MEIHLIEVEKSDEKEKYEDRKLKIQQSSSGYGAAVIFSVTWC